MMGLDQYMYKRIKEKEEGESDEELGYWRKFNALQHFMEDMWYDEHDEDINCQEIVLSEETIESIINRCLEAKNVMMNAIRVRRKYDSECEYDGFDDASEELLKTIFPTTHGFFYGGTEYDDYYEEGVDQTLEVFSKALELVRDGEEVYYYCWY